MINNHITITRGNKKTKIKSFNLLAGKGNYNGALPGKLRGVVCVGTCAHDCHGCYAKRVTRYDNVFLAYLDNTINAIADPVETVAAVEMQLYGGRKRAPRFFRVHDSGDFFSYKYFCAWMACARRHPETRFYAYTKSNNIVLRYGVDNIPGNFTLLCSPWAGVCDAIADLPQFIYDDGSDAEIAKLPHCPAVDKNGNRTGITCAQCGACPKAKRGTRRAVYAH